MPGLSVHVVDVARGTPASGMRVTVWRLEPGGARHRAGGGTVGDGGLLDDPALGGGTLAAGVYEVELAAGDWYRAQGLALDEPAFQETVLYRFGLADPAQHVHLPIKMSPWGVSIWRGR
ncbi:MAG TPA: hydroxyisourate hydrolase [Burkholderiaceae bacterium]|nr:hydroxyisourate hydrolase [Burkholderiaceae bacterium]